MKLSKLMAMLLGMSSFFRMGIGEDEGGGGGDDEAARLAAEAEAEAARLAAEAAAKAGKTGPTDAEAKLLRENMQKKEALKKAGEELTKLQEQLKQFEGIDPEAVKKLLADQKTAEEKALESKGDYENLKKRMGEEHAKEVGKLQAQIQALSEQVGKSSSLIGDLTVGTQFSQSKFIADEMTLTPAKARVIYGDHFDVVDGQVVAFDKPRGKANRTPVVDQYGNGLPFDAAMAKIIEADPEKDHLLKSKVKPGAGSNSAKPNAQPAKEAPQDGLSKIAAGLKSAKLPV